uniref:Uncharacterized protein n=1 Tax=Meloidogyne enterolobii TaxID=390850 RepID=A0A6V7U7K7_MELEN|nr:unnamed protein product [Meloidogyne enterolobii]
MGELRYTKDSKQLEEFKSDLTDLNNEIINKENKWVSEVKNLLKHYKEIVNVAINLKNEENNFREETKLAVKNKCKEEMNNNEIEVPKYKIKEIKEIMYEFDEELKTINNKMEECTYEYERLKGEFKKYYDENKLNKYKILLLDINYYSKDYFEAIKKAKDLIGENKDSSFSNNNSLKIPKLKRANPKKKEIKELLENKEILKNDWNKINKMKRPVEKFVEKAKELLSEIEKEIKNFEKTDQIFLETIQKLEFEKLNYGIIKKEGEEEEESISDFEGSCRDIDSPRNYQIETTDNLSDGESFESEEEYEESGIINLFKDNPEDKDFFSSFLLQLENKPTIIYLIHQYEHKIKKGKKQVQIKDSNFVRECRKYAMEKLNEQYVKKQIDWNDINFIKINLEAYQIKIKEGTNIFYNSLLEENFNFNNEIIVENKKKK